METNPKARVIALYLPQFHPTPENDLYWGKGFTEWTNVAKAKPLFRGHDQPRIPADLGFYDLRLQESAIQQANLARQAGIEGFCYWHYWFGGGIETLQMPLDRLIETGTPDYPFCVGWANHDWTTGSWTARGHSRNPSMIFKQQYLGAEDNFIHFMRLLPAFMDKRYITVDGKLLFLIFDPDSFIEFNKFKLQWNELAQSNGLPSFHFVCVAHSADPRTVSNFSETAKTKYLNYINQGYDGIYSINQKYAEVMSGGLFHKVVHSALRRFCPGFIVEKYRYGDIMKHYYTELERAECVYPQLLAGWDRSPRAGKRAIIYYNDTPKEFRLAVERVVDIVSRKQYQHKLVFLNSWNEWGEGAYLEPDLRYGNQKLNMLRQVLLDA